MKRPAGVTGSAGVAIIGSLFTLSLAGMLVSAGVISQAPGPDIRGIIIGTAVVLAVLSILGLATAWGLLYLRPWARITALVFAGIMAAVSAMIVAFITTVPMVLPTGTDPNISRIGIPFMLVMYGIPLGIGIWWLIQFNRQSTKEAFASTETVDDSNRALSVSIIGWLHLIGGLLCLLPIIGGLPLFAAGFIFSGWSASLGYALLGVITAMIGWGLLRLDERARKASIAYFVLSAAHGAYVALVPGVSSRLIDFETTILPAGGPPPPPMNYPAILTMSMIFGLAVSALGIWLLVRNKAAFQTSSAEPGTTILSDGF